MTAAKSQAVNAGRKHSWKNLECHLKVLRNDWLNLKHVRPSRLRRAQAIVSDRVAATAISMLRRYGGNVNEQEVEEIVQSWHVQMLENGFQRYDGRPIHRLAFLILQRLVFRRMRKYAREAVSLPEFYDVADSCDLPPRSAIRGEIAEKVLDAVEILTSKNKGAVKVWLQRCAGENVEDVESPSTQHSRFHRAKRELEIMLGEFSDLDW